MTTSGPTAPQAGFFYRDLNIDSCSAPVSLIIT